MKRRRLLTAMALAPIAPAAAKAVMPTPSADPISGMMVKALASGEIGHIDGMSFHSSIIGYAQPLQVLRNQELKKFMSISEDLPCPECGGMNYLMRENIYWRLSMDDPSEIGRELKKLDNDIRATNGRLRSIQQKLGTEVMASDEISDMRYTFWTLTAINAVILLGHAAVIYLLPKFIG